MARKLRILFGLGLCVLSLSAMLLNPPGVYAQDGDALPTALVLTVKGPITPIMSVYLDRGMRIAEEKGAEVIILQLDTPGGSIDLMNKIIQQIRGSKIPVVVYVTPRGAMAGSAGTIITLAGHVAAMAPETTIGAASPVGAQGEDIGSTMETKVKEMLKASVRAIASARDPEAVELAEETIESGRAVSSQEALEVGLIDIEAEDLEDLLKQLDGMEIMVGTEEVVLNTSDALTLPVENSVIEELLLTLTNPNIVFILLSIGIQTILIELSSPGGWVSGFIGSVCLLLAIYGLGVLPVNWVGLLFLVVAFILFLMDIKAPTHGALTVAGAAAFIAGALILFNSAKAPGVPTVSVPLVVGTGLFIAATFFTILTFALRAQRLPIKIGREALPGKFGIVRSELNPHGQVQVSGELWIAELFEGDTLAEGTRIEVIAVEGLHLKVRKAE